MICTTDISTSRMCGCAISQDLKACYFPINASLSSPWWYIKKKLLYSLYMQFNDCIVLLHIAIPNKSSARKALQILRASHMLSLQSPLLKIHIVDSCFMDWALLSASRVIVWWTLFEFRTFSEKWHCVSIITDNIAFCAEIKKLGFSISPLIG